MIPAMEDPVKSKLKIQRQEGDDWVPGWELDDVERGMTSGNKDSLGMNVYVHCPDYNHGFMSIGIW